MHVAGALKSFIGRKIKLSLAAASFWRPFSFQIIFTLAWSLLACGTVLLFSIGKDHDIRLDRSDRLIQANSDFFPRYDSEIVHTRHLTFPDLRQRAFYRLILS